MAAIYTPISGILSVVGRYTYLPFVLSWSMMMTNSWNGVIMQRQFRRGIPLVRSRGTIDNKDFLIMSAGIGRVLYV